MEWQRGEIENKEMTEKSYKTKSWFFENKNKIDKPLARLTKENKEPTQQNSKWKKHYNRYHVNIRIIRSYCEITTDITLLPRWGLCIHLADPFNLLGWHSAVNSTETP